MRFVLVCLPMLAIVVLSSAGCTSGLAQTFPNPNPVAAATIPGIEFSDGIVLPNGMLLLDGGASDAVGNSPLGAELYISDGTPEGTTLLLDIFPGPVGGLNSIFPTPFNGGAYFTAETPEAGRELWFSDGTLEGTFMIEDTSPGPANSIIREPLLEPGMMTFLVNIGAPGDANFGTRILTFAER